MGKREKQGGSNSKHGRNRDDCVRYWAENRRERNRTKRLRRHLKRQPNDKCAAAALKRPAP